MLSNLLALAAAVYKVLLPVSHDSWPHTGVLYLLSKPLPILPQSCRYIRSALLTRYALGLNDMLDLTPCVFINNYMYLQRSRQGRTNRPRSMTMICSHSEVEVVG